MTRWKFSAVLTADDKRTGYKKGKKFDPKGFYYNGKNVVLVGSVKDDHAGRLSFPADIVEVNVERDFAKPKKGVKWGIWMFAIAGEPAGWWCGFGKRQNEQLHRIKYSDDADYFMSEENAEDKAEGFRCIGWDCVVKQLGA